jgi:hypothetical protein
MLAISRVVDSRSTDCWNDSFLLYYQLSILSSRKFRRGEITTLIRPVEIIRDLQRAPTSAISHAIDSRSRDCGNDGVLLWRGPMSAISRAIDSRSRDCGNDGVLLWRAPMSAISRAIDSRSTDCGNDGVWLWRAQTLAMLCAIDSRSRDCGNDGVLLWRAPTPAISHAIDSRTIDCGNEGFLLYCQLPSPSSRKFRRGKITTLIRPVEIIRDL